MEKFTRTEAIEIVGDFLVMQVDKENCVPSSRVTDGTEYQGYDEYTADAQDNDYRVRAHYYHDTVVTKNVPLDCMDWSIDHYTVETI